MPNPSKSPNIPRTLANALFACSFMTWQRVDGPTVPQGETVQVESFAGVTDEELVDMIDGGIFHIDGQDFSFDTVDAKNWSMTIVKMWETGKPNEPRFDGAATCSRTGTMIHLGKYAAHAYGAALDLIEPSA